MSHQNTGLVGSSNCAVSVSYLALLVQLLVPRPNGDGFDAEHPVPTEEISSRAIAPSSASISRPSCLIRERANLTCSSALSLVARELSTPPYFDEDRAAKISRLRTRRVDPLDRQKLRCQLQPGVVAPQARGRGAEPKRRHPFYSIRWAAVASLSPIADEAFAAFDSAEETCARSRTRQSRARTTAAS